MSCRNSHQHSERSVFSEPWEQSGPLASHTRIRPSPAVVLPHTFTAVPRCHPPAPAVPTPHFSLKSLHPKSRRKPDGELHLLHPWRLEVFCTHHVEAGPWGALPSTRAFPCPAFLACREQVSASWTFLSSKGQIEIVTDERSEGTQKQREGSPETIVQRGGSVRVPPEGIYGTI